MQSSSPAQLDFWEQMDELTPSNAFECTKTLLAAGITYVVLIVAQPAYAHSIWFPVMSSLQTAPSQY